MRTWFGRAGSCPLSFSVSGDVGNLSGMLVRYTPRIERLYIYLAREHFGEIARLSFPLLEKLTIEYNEDPETDLEPLAGTFRNAPRLTELVVTGANIAALRPSILPLPYAQLSKLTCCLGAALNGEDFVAILKTAPSLVEVTVELDEDSEICNVSGLITHDHLQILRIQSAFTSDFEEVFNHIGLPVLQKIYISLQDRVPFPTWWISTMSAVTDIEIRQSELDMEEETVGDFFLMLHRRPNNEFFPHLQSLAFNGCVLNMNIVVDALASRCASLGGGSTPLRSFRQIWPNGSVNPLKKSMVKLLWDLVGKGMEIHVGPEDKNCC
ncbi:hypothetical protein C8R43DRAFT_969643 [Mycena crocata]|nr:hypothetical protein C8R43DRAFT_969643 [Mycena crocata]